VTHWTKPKTWVDGETVTAATLNTHVRDNFDFLHHKDRVHAVQTQDNEVKDSEWEVVRFGGEGFDRGDMHNSRKRPAQIVSRQDGLYLVIFHITFEDAGAGGTTRHAMLRRNSNQNDDGGHKLGEWVRGCDTGFQTPVEGSVLTRLRKGDHVNIFAKQTSGAALPLLSGSINTSFFQAVQMGG
jgi:hypothetical protein